VSSGRTSYAVGRHWTHAVRRTELDYNLVMTAQDTDAGVSPVERARPYYCKLPKVRACIRRYKVGCSE
jgi:hypothetical protein